ncbi:hypothetical protein ABZ896_37660 [Streptomyces sp. NPDC047072]|uniref:hypothetical protein n=1 Tax=Streptomyces sp. NPDC047072 TaxID=3154809 RepID=UPI0033CB4D59
MLRATSTPGRRHALIGASAAVVCLGAVLAACGGGSGEGYVALVPPASSGTAVRPTGDVTLVPLDVPQPKSPTASGTSATPSAKSPQNSATGVPAPGTEGAKHSRTPATSGPETPGASQAPPAPAALTWSAPTRQATDERRCDDVTLVLHNTGGSPATSGTVTFGTHIIGALGIDWATVESVQELPVPIDAGARVEKTWTVCVDAWRVPLGMHVETRDVTVRWS